MENWFSDEPPEGTAKKIAALRAALRRQGWSLSKEGVLSALGEIDLNTGGREALDEQLARLRAATEDPALLLGTAKDLLEAVAKFVLEASAMVVPAASDFNYLWHLARDRLNVLPEQVDDSLPGARQIKAIHQSTWKIAEQVNQLRGLQGTGHGRTLPTGVSADMALLVVREACSVAEFMLATLDRSLGRR